MQLKLKHLQKVVKRVRDEEKSVETLKLEVNRVLGPIMDTDCKLDVLAEQVNDRVSVLTKTGRTSHLGFKPSTVVPFMNHENPEVRSMAANLLPQRFLSNMKDDPHSMVRAVVASRIDMSMVREMMKRFPRDDELRSIYRLRRKERQLNEDGVPKPKLDDEPFDIYGEERLGDVVKTPEGPELSDEWYAETASKLFQTYDKNIDGGWEEKAVHNLVAHTKVTSGVEIDEEKLLKTIKDQIEEREDKVIERDALKELAAALYEEADLLEESSNFYTDDSDPVKALLNSNLTPSAYLDEANKLFQVKESTIPLGIKKFRVGELALTSEQTIPMKAKIPGSGSPRALDEHALDLYVKHWNERQALVGEPLRIKWSIHPSGEGVIGFQAVLR